MKNQISILMTKPMDRQSFIKHVGLAIIMFLGITNVLNALGAGESQSQMPGYGETDYGR